MTTLLTGNLSEVKKQLNIPNNEFLGVDNGNEYYLKDGYSLQLINITEYVANHDIEVYKVLKHGFIVGAIKILTSSKFVSTFYGFRKLESAEWFIIEKSHNHVDNDYGMDLFNQSNLILKSDYFQI